MSRVPINGMMGSMLADDERDLVALSGLYTSMLDAKWMVFPAGCAFQATLISQLRVLCWIQAATAVFGAVHLQGGMLQSNSVKLYCRDRPAHGFCVDDHKRSQNPMPSAYFRISAEWKPADTVLSLIERVAIILVRYIRLKNPKVGPTEDRATMPARWCMLSPLRLGSFGQPQQSRKKFRSQILP